MDTIKEVTVYSIGDSSMISTWSNVPFFLTETLISKGIKVNRVDLSPSPILTKIYSLTCHRIIRLIYSNTTNNYFRSLIHFLDSRLRIWKAVRHYEASEANIFLTFSFSSIGLTNKPAILLCDWTYDHYLKYFINKDPDIFEKKCIQREDAQIEGSDLIFTLFPVIANYMSSRYKNRNIFYLGNVINSSCNPDKSIAKVKSKSSNLLFIGRKKYIQGALNLINAFRILKEQYPDLSLNIIGMECYDFDALPEGVNCYGYLDKNKNKDLYYSLLENATMFVNTTSKWAAFSATLEALYFYTPVIITRYNEFVATFGDDIGFGCYCEDDSIESLCANIIRILNHKTYSKLCINAHEAVKNFTWDVYVDKMLGIMKERL